MMRDVADLTTARPHMRTTARFSVTERHAYAEGYYMGLVMALRVLDAAVENYRLATRTRRAAARQKESA